MLSLCVVRMSETYCVCMVRSPNGPIMIKKSRTARRSVPTLQDAAARHVICLMFGHMISLRGVRMSETYCLCRVRSPNGPIMIKISDLL